MDRTSLNSNSHGTITTRALTIIGICVGAAMWWGLRRVQPQDVRTQQDALVHWIALGVALIACLLPISRRRIARGIERLRAASPRTVRWLTAGVFVVVTCYLGITATWQGRDLFPQWHDQQMTLIQAQMLARGRLWMPQHPCADFFETFYVLVKPVYAPIYFPGAALFYVPSVWLHLPWWLQPLLASGALAALLFRVIAEVIDPAAGILAALYLTALWIFRLLSLWEMSHTVFALLALWAIWSWLQRRKSHCPGWAISLGAAMGWAAITRPLDAVAYAIPLGIALLWDFGAIGWKSRFTSAGLIVVAAIPFLSLQLILDRGVAGHFFRTPFQYYYSDAEFAGLSAHGRMPSPDAHAISPLPQMQLFTDRFIIPTFRRFASENFPARLNWRCQEAAMALLPSGFLLVLLPVGLIGLKCVRGLVLAVPIATFLVLYSFYPFWLNHYCLAIAAGVIPCVLLGIRMICEAWPQKDISSTFLNVAVFGLLLTSLPEFHPNYWDETNDWPAVSFNYETLPDEVKTPALVLYRYWKLPPRGSTRSVEQSVRNFNDEPVYNVDVAWPDNAPIIRAHDLGERDMQIIDYYAKIQANRNVYLVDRTDLQVHYLGEAGELAKRIRSGQSIWPPGLAPSQQ